jgi:hypothetical protein
MRQTVHESRTFPLGKSDINVGRFVKMQPKTNRVIDPDGIFDVRQPIATNRLSYRKDATNNVFKQKNM